MPVTWVACDSILHLFVDNFCACLVMAHVFWRKRQATKQNPVQARHAANKRNKSVYLPELRANLIKFSRTNFGKIYIFSLKQFGLVFQFDECALSNERLLIKIYMGTSRFCFSGKFYKLRLFIFRFNSCRQQTDAPFYIHYYLWETMNK